MDAASAASAGPLRSVSLWFNFRGARDGEAKRLQLSVVKQVATIALPRFPVAAAILDPLTDDTRPRCAIFIPAFVERSGVQVPAVFTLAPTGDISVVPLDGGTGGEVLPLGVSWACRGFGAA